MANEAGAVFGSHSMGKESVMRNLSMFNKLWEGGTLRVDRRTTPSFTVKGARLTMGLMVQKQTLQSYFDKTGPLARGIGFLARFLVSLPESTQGTRFYTEPPEIAPKKAAFNRRIAGILNRPVTLDENGGLMPEMLTLTPEAKAAWAVLHDEVELQLGSGGELSDVRDVAAKAADNVARLSALFHVFEGESGPIGANSVARAGRIVAWHLNESRRFFGELALPPELADPARLDAWLIAYCKRERTLTVPTRNTQRLGPIRDKTRLSAALAELEELNRVRLTQNERRKSIEVNPALVES